MLELKDLFFHLIDFNALTLILYSLKVSFIVFVLPNIEVIMKYVELPLTSGCYNECRASLSFFTLLALDFKR